MAPLEIDTSVPALSMESIDAARTAEQAGCDRVWTAETDNDAFLPLPLVAEHTDEITFGTRIALSFTRSPMVLAYKSWELARYSNGRFVLGLGTQVKAHNERRFDVDWDAPGPRLREVVESVRHIWEVFQGDRETLDYEGEHYSFSLMTDAFDPGPIDHPDIPIHIAGVNEYNLRLAGELCDGLAIHPFTTPAYIEDVIQPLVAEGASRTDRALEDVSLSMSPLVITGETADELEQRREEVRERLAFYGSTRTYHDVLEHHGWRNIGVELHECSVDGRWDEMPELVPDEMVAEFALEGRPDDLPAKAERAYGGAVDRLSVPLESVSAFE